MKFTKIQKKDYKNFSTLKDLNNLAEVPPVIYAIGNIDLLNSNTITIIGSRKISSYGQQVIKDIVPELALNGLCVVSGLAYGCDFLAQKTAVDNSGTTIGVLGFGLNHIKTHQHYLFIKECLEKNVGLFISEFEPDMAAGKWTFVRRDRIMAGLGKKLIVIEAGIKSGTMHTVNFALELGKEVFAVPGNITNSNSLGTNLLIQNGANVLLCAGDTLGGFKSSYINTPRIDLTGVQLQILELLKNESTSLQVAKQVSCSASQVMSDLTLLEVKGYIKRIGDKWVMA